MIKLIVGTLITFSFLSLACSRPSVPSETATPAKAGLGVEGYWMGQETGGGYGAWHFIIKTGNAMTIESPSNDGYYGTYILDSSRTPMTLTFTVDSRKNGDSSIKSIRGILKTKVEGEFTQMTLATGPWGSDQFPASFDKTGDVRLFTLLLQQQ